MKEAAFQRWAHDYVQTDRSQACKDAREATERFGFPVVVVDFGDLGYGLMLGSQAAALASVGITDTPIIDPWTADPLGD